jgi:hypothetical protein
MQIWRQLYRYVLHGVNSDVGPTIEQCGFQFLQKECLTPGTELRERRVQELVAQSSHRQESNVSTRMQTTELFRYVFRLPKRKRALARRNADHCHIVIDPLFRPLDK